MRQSLSTLTSSRGQHFSARSGSHSFSEAMLFGSLTLFRLIGSQHPKTPPLLLTKKTGTGKILPQPVFFNQKTATSYFAILCNVYYITEFLFLSIKFAQKEGFCLGRYFFAPLNEILRIDFSKITPYKKPGAILGYFSLYSIERGKSL